MQKQEQRGSMMALWGEYRREATAKLNSHYCRSQHNKGPLHIPEDTKAAMSQVAFFFHHLTDHALPLPDKCNCQRMMAMHCFHTTFFLHAGKRNDLRTLQAFMTLSFLLISKHKQKLGNWLVLLPLRIKPNSAKVYRCTRGRGEGIFPNSPGPSN